MSAPAVVELDALIFGGGVAGLWTLDELIRRGFAAALVERRSLGAGQTICSQGILHGGLKYALAGIITESTQSVRAMPAHWAACMKGERAPDLRDVRILSSHCYLWRTDSIASRLFLWGARTTLQTPVEKVADAERPAPLSRCPGQMFRVEEPVIDVESFLDLLAERHRDRLFLVAEPSEVRFTSNTPGLVDSVELCSGQNVVRVRPSKLIFTSGEGNAALRRAVGLDAELMQRRPLHMVMVRGPLPDLFGHCIDNPDRPRLTVTTAHDRASRTVWHLGGEIAETNGVARNPAAQIAAAKQELNAVVPGLDLKGVEWAAYRVDRTEGRTGDGRRPDGPQCSIEGNVITAWPTKLVLAPRLAETIGDQMGEPIVKEADLPDWPRPVVADPPWEVTKDWHS